MESRESVEFSERACFHSADVRLRQWALDSMAGGPVLPLGPVHLILLEPKMA
jgi:hypothetical protein